MAENTRVKVALIDAKLNRGQVSYIDFKILDWQRFLKEYQPEKHRKKHRCFTTKKWCHSPILLFLK